MKTRVLLSSLALLLLLSGCNFATATAPEEDPNAQITAAVMTVYVQLTEAARAAELAATATFTPEPPPTATPLPTETPTSAFTETPQVPPTDAPTATQASDLPCLRANLESKSIANGTKVYIDRTFTQTFRLKNTGACTWNGNFELRFIGGDLMGAGASIILTTSNVPTWGYVNIDILMKAPSAPGHYANYWMIKSDSGEIFGVGPAGSQSFSTEIQALDDS